MANVIAAKLVLDDKELEKFYKDYDKNLKKVGRTGRKSGEGIKKGFTAAKGAILAATAVLTGIIIGLNKAVKIASDFEEANSRMLTVFKNNTSEARILRDELVETYFMSTRAASQFLGHVGAITKGLGLQEEQALKLAGETIKFSADLASASNAMGGAEAVANALASAYTGEREALKTYGIVITEADVKSRLFSLGQSKLTGNALKAAKAQATLQLAMERQSDAIGDLQRTQDSYANVQRRTAAATEDVALKLGAVFLPIWSKVMLKVNEFMKYLYKNEIGGILYATWEAFKEFGSRLLKLFEGLGETVWAFVKGDFVGMKDGVEKVYGALAEGWGATALNIVAAHERGEKAVKKFLDGEISAMKDAEAQKQADIDQAQQKREEKSQKLHQRFIDNVQKEMYAAGEANVEMANAEKEKVDYMIESERFTSEEILLIMTERLENIRVLRGQDSLEYMQALDAKKKYEEKLEEQKLKNKQKNAKSQIKIARGMAGAMGAIGQLVGKKSKAVSIIQGIINTYLGITKALSGSIPPWNFIQAAAVGVAGFKAVTSMRSQGFAEGGRLEKGKKGYIEGWKNEIIAPEKNYIDVTNQLIASGQIGGQSSTKVLEKKLDKLVDVFRSLNLEADFENEKIALAVEQGNIELEGKTY